ISTSSPTSTHSLYLFFLFNHPAPTHTYTLSLHDALPISSQVFPAKQLRLQEHRQLLAQPLARQRLPLPATLLRATGTAIVVVDRSEEHTSELQSPCNLVCRLLLEKKKKKNKNK